jgi:hypothetical protein
MKGHKLSQEEQYQIRQLYEAGYSLHKTGKMTGRASSTVYTVLKRLGISFRPATHFKQPPPDKVEQMIKLHEEGLGTVKIGKILGYSPNWVYAILVHNGIKFPERRRNILDDGAGYRIVYQPDHPKATKRGYIREHILVWEKAHAQQLPEGWIIHHLNGKRDDNRPENLFATPRKSHYPGMHHRDILIKELRKRIRALEAQLAQERLAI